MGGVGYDAEFAGRGRRWIPAFAGMTWEGAGYDVWEGVGVMWEGAKYDGDDERNDVDGCGGDGGMVGG